VPVRIVVSVHWEGKMAESPINKLADDDSGDLGRVRNLIRAVLDAVEEAWREWQTYFRVKSVDLTLKTVLDNKGGVSPSLKIPVLGEDGKLTAGLDINTVATQEVKLTITPASPKDVKIEDDVRNTIKEAVDVIKQALEELKLANKYGLDSATITLDFVVTTEGKISIVVAEFTRKKELAHNIVITVDDEIDDQTAGEGDPKTVAKT
jgi:hypothetical protein